MKTNQATGPTGQFRQLRPSDLANFREHLLRLDAESRRDRSNGVTDDIFIKPKNKKTEDYITGRFG